MAETRPTSLRLPAPTVALLDAWATWLTLTRARNTSRVDVIETLLRRAPAPADLVPEARAVREARKKMGE